MVCKWCGREMTDITRAGKSNHCKPCHASYERERRIKHGTTPRRLRDRRLDGSGLRECFRCNKVKSVEDFSPSTRGYLSLSAYCRPCNNEYIHQHRDSASAYVRKWRSGNQRWKDCHRAQQAKRRAQKTNTDTGLVTVQVVQSILSDDLCAYCGRRIDLPKRTIDHVIPLSRGGAHHPDNLVMACGPCNSSKRDLTAEEYKRRRRGNSG